MKRYINFLKSEKLVRKLVLIQLISYFGAWFSNVAIYTLLIQMNVSVMIIALVAALHFLPGALIAPFSGAIIDKYPPKILLKTLIIIEIIATFLLTLVSDASYIYLLYILVFIRMGAASFYFTTEMSLLPKLLKNESLHIANEIQSIVWSLSYTVGMALSGFFVYKFGVMMAFIVDGFMFIVALLLLLPLELPKNKNIVEQKILLMMKDTFTYIKSNPVILALITLHATVGFTAYDALMVLIVDYYYSDLLAVSLALGLLNSFRAIGLVIGPLFISKLINNSSLTYLFILQGLTLFIFSSFLDSFYLTLFTSIIVGLSATTLWSYTYTLLQHHTDSAYYGRVVAYNDMFFLLVASFSGFLIGFLANFKVSLVSITDIFGVIFILCGLYYIWLKNKFVLKEVK
ncbi:MAG: MFS transporter [Helicobacteraceae bacterium]|nr:MFS transporter [Helicobacteraceae bacterium]